MPHLFDSLPESERIARLVAADRNALDGVRCGHGGPFGAGLALYVPQADGTLQPYLLGEDHNRVLATGFAGAHAEHTVLDGCAAKLTAMLHDRPDALAVLYSSGESCSACRTKAEIAARRLMAAGLLQPGRFVTAFGATYDDAMALAGFNDGPYLDDIRRPAAARGIACKPVTLAGLPAAVPAEWRQSPRPWAGILSADGQWLAGAHDLRSDTRWFARPELAAIAAASAAARDANAATPWDLAGAVLVSSSPGPVGPLTYASAQWANIGSILCCSDGPVAESDAPGIADAALFAVIAGSYDHPDGAVRTVPVDAARAQLRAQLVWGEAMRDGTVPLDNLYNGWNLAVETV